MNSFKNINHKPRVKICCISSLEEANMAIEHGASVLGLVGHMPSGPGVISDERIREIADQVSSPVSTFLLTSETRAEDIIAHYRKVQTTTIQIVDQLEDYRYEAIKKELPHVKLVQVIHVTGRQSVEEAVAVSEHVDAILLDSGNPNLSVKELGGTGRTHNWEISREIREAVTVPLFLAGGLNQNNIKSAIETVHPFGVDLCSGVRTNGKLDRNKLKAFFAQIEKVTK